MTLHVLLWMPEHSRVPGGHNTQLEKTAAALRNAGVAVRTASEEAPSLKRIDVVHGFGLSPRHFRHARVARLPVALSSVYWNLEYLAGLDDRGRPWASRYHRLRTAAVLARAAWRGRHPEKCGDYSRAAAHFHTQFELADLLLPNSEGEALAILEDLGVGTPMHVVPNAVDHTRFADDESIEHDDKPYVLMAGRFEPHKNQLGLIRAMNGSGIPLKLIGPPHPDHPRYYDACRRAAVGNVELLPPVPHYEELIPVYQRARVHALPSWYETTGLVSLEAALCGANVVTTDRGNTRDYFEGDAWFCDPARPATIRRAVEDAFAAAPRHTLRRRIRSRYTWAHAAEATLEGYHKLLGRTPLSSQPPSPPWRTDASGEPTPGTLTLHA
ncbi:MAG: glycosyltransferase family 4 protein [Planctomycetota bacterium]